MACLSDDELVAWLDGKLDSDAAALIEEHLTTCAACRGATLGPAHAPFVAGAQIGRYRLDRFVGAGAMGIVWAAHDELLDRTVALKMLSPCSFSEDEYRPARLLREAQLLARLQHPNVIAVYDAGSLGSQAFLAMELFDGASLRQWAHGRSQAERLRALVHAGQGLAAAHRAGLVHRDIKPDNILVASSGRVAIGDFGLAHTREADDGSARSPLTAANTIAGTPAYMAPEVLAGEPADERSDQYSFCMTLCEIMHGDRAKQATNPSPPHMPRWLDRVIARGLQPSPRARFASMDMLVAELTRRRSRPSRVLVLALMLATMAGGLLIRQQRRVVRARRACTIGTSEPPVWSSARRDALYARLGRNAAAQPARWASLGALDAFFAEWTAQRETACQTPIVDEGGEALLLRRLACLVDRLDRAKTLIDLLFEAGQDHSLVASALERLPSLAECRSPSVAGPPSPATDELRLRLARVLALNMLGRLSEAEPLAKAVDSEASHSGYDPLRAEAACALGEVYQAQARYREAREAFYRCIWAAEKAHDERHKAHAWRTLALMSGFGNPGGLEEALSFLGNARAALTAGRIGGIEAVEVDIIEAEILRSTNHLANALQVIEQAMTRATTDGASTQRLRLQKEKSIVLFALGRPQEALALAETATRGAQTLYGPDQPATALFLMNNVISLEAMGRYNQAVELVQAALAIEHERGDSPSELAFAWSELADCHDWQGLFEDGLSAALRSLAFTERMTGVDNEQLTDALVTSARLYLELHQAAPAKRLLDRALALAAHDSRDEALSRLMLAEYDVEVRQARRGLAEARHALAMWEALGSVENDSEAAEMYSHLGHVALAADEPDTALAAYRQAVALYESTHQVFIWRDLYGAARAHAKLRHRDQALALVDRAIATYRKTDGDSKRLHDMVTFRHRLTAEERTGVDPAPSTGRCNNSGEDLGGFHPSKRLSRA